MRFMGKEEFIEAMAAAKEEEQEKKEHVNMADAAKVSEEVKTAVQTGTGKQITRLVEKRRGRKPESKNISKTDKTKTKTASWQRHIKDSIKALASEGEVKIEQIKSSVEEIETLMLQIEVLDDKIRETEEALKDINGLMERIQTLEDMIK